MRQDNHNTRQSQYETITRQDKPIAKGDNHKIRRQDMTRQANRKMKQPQDKKTRHNRARQSQDKTITRQDNHKTRPSQNNNKTRQS